jgi:hypothetical protein
MIGTLVHPSAGKCWENLGRNYTSPKSTVCRENTPLSHSNHTLSKTDLKIGCSWYLWVSNTEENYV